MDVWSEQRKKMVDGDMWPLCPLLHFDRRPTDLQWAVWVSRIPTLFRPGGDVDPSQATFSKRWLKRRRACCTLEFHTTLPHDFLWKKCVSSLPRKANTDFKMGHDQEGNMRELLVSTLMDDWIHCVSLFQLSAWIYGQSHKQRRKKQTAFWWLT